VGWVGPDKCASCLIQRLLAAALCWPLGLQLAHSLSSFSEALHYKVLVLDRQIVSLEADLKAEDAVINALS